MNKKIGLFLPHFGKLPNYFDFWIKSVAINPEISFILITDQELGSNLPKNLYIVKRQFKDIQDLVRRKFNTLNISLESPYKLCDFRPAYGYIFDDLVKKYNLDYWGFCDPDVIWGKINKFLFTKGFYKEYYDKVGYLGHFQFFSNNQKFLFKDKIDKEKFRDYEYVFTHKYSYHFDEEIGIGSIAKRKGLNILNFEDNPPYADILIDSFQFYTYKNASDFSLPRYFHWNQRDGLMQVAYDGSKYRITPKMYVHLQKRNIKIKVNPLEMSFYVIPNEIISNKEFNELNPKEIMKNKFYFEYHFEKFKKYVKKLSIGQIRHTYYFQKLLESYYSEGK